MVMTDFFLDFVDFLMLLLLSAEYCCSLAGKLSYD